MGLAVYVYKDVKRTDVDYDVDFFAYVINESWKHKVKNLEYDKGYKGSDCFSFVSYSYRNHSRFREFLLKVISREDLLNDGRIIWEKLVIEKDLPFYDFINFADNEGCLDWEISGKIFKDFIKFKNNMLSTEADVYFKNMYENWMETFEHGKEKGSVVVFM